MKVNYIYGRGIECESFTNILSTNTTSITIVTDVTSTSYTASTSITITKQTLYFSGGVISDLGNASSTRVAVLA